MENQNNPKCLIISGTPKKSGLCRAMIEEAGRGAEEGGARVEVLEVDKLARCRVCGDGWGTCRDRHLCVFGDDGFAEAQRAVRAADQLCLITPVYFAEMSETLKCFTDRLRRCESDLPWHPRPEGTKAALSGKPILLAASAGGSGNGLLPCLGQLERFCRHTGAVIFDFIGVNRWNRDYKALAVHAAAKAMAEGRRPGENLG